MIPTGAMRRVVGAWPVLPVSLSILGLLLPFATRALASHTGPFVWALDLAAHWQMAFAFALIVCVPFAARRSRSGWWWLALAALPWCTASPTLPVASSGAAVALVVAEANVNADNRNPAPLRTWLDAQRNDIVVLHELTPAYAGMLLRDERRWPHRALSPADSPFGVGLLSSFPLRDVRRFDGQAGLALLIATVDLPQGHVRVAGVHPMPPFAPGWRERRDRVLRILSHERDAGLPLLVVGDLNATPWSTALTGGTAGDLRRATPLTPTWTPFPPLPLGLPIDHVLASPQWQRVDAARGPDIGSDHRPIRVALALSVASPVAPAREGMP